MKEKKVLSAVLGGKCPRCRQGEIFKYPLYQVSHLSKTNERCPVCDLQFEVEPGFWTGAMYVSYAFSVAILLTTTFVLYFGFNDPPVPAYILTVAAISAVTYPFNFRYSRIIFLYLFSGTKYDARFATKRKA